MTNCEYIDIDIDTYCGSINGDLIIYEKGDTPNNGLMLYGFDEVGMFDHEFDNPQYCIMKEKGS